MPYFTIVIPAYDNASLLGNCLESIAGQSFADWEAIVVNDASPDDTSKIARSFAAGDPRFSVIDKSENGGLHLARKTGTEQASGTYITYLDADDELLPDALEKLHRALTLQPVDLLRFGIQVKPAGASKEACEAYELRANRPFPLMSGRESIRMSYELDGGFEQDWRTWANVLPTERAQLAFELMTDERLERAEDSLEFMAFASVSRTQATRTDIVGYRYNFGSGVTGPSPLSARQFIGHARQFCSCMDALERYADSFGPIDLHPAARGARIKLQELMFNDWNARVSEEEKPETYDELVSLYGVETVATELMRLTRDASYAKLASGLRYDSDDAFIGWFEKASQLMSGRERSASSHYRRAATAARLNLTNLRTSQETDDYSDQPIRVFVSMHKAADRFDSDILQPVQVGAANASWPLPYCLRDDEGDNISALNPQYCELTAQYWAWKNVDAEYYGFCHYRRYFDFGSERHEENAWGEVMESRIDEASQKRYGLDDDSIRAAIEGFDVVTTEEKDLRKYPVKADNPIEQWHLSASLRDDDLVDMLAILCEQHPDYVEDVMAYSNGHVARFCNMFIMRKGIFHDYCAWLFPLLDQFCATRDFSTYSREAMRTPGHLAERLLNIYLAHHERTGAGWKTKQVQCVHFENTLSGQVDAPPNEGEARFKQTIPIVLAADNAYVPMLTTTIHSLLSNASRDYHYDITVMTTDITPENAHVMREHLCKDATASLHLLNVLPLIGKYDLSTNNPHIGIETYYRFLIQEALPDYDKVLYLDSDLIVKGDVSELFSVELGDNLIGAVIDVDYLGNLNLKNTGRLEYSKSVLGLDNPYEYFQAGVLVMNTGALRHEVPVSTWLEEAQDTRYIYNDQDILNVYCKGRVTFLDPSWNVMHDGFNRIAGFCSHAPAAAFEAYLDAREHEKIIHYAGAEKPWNTIGCDRAADYWAYARETPFYEHLVALFAHSAGEQLDEGARSKADYQIIGDHNPIRAVVDPVFPPGSKRREAARTIVKKVVPKSQ